MKPLIPLCPDTWGALRDSYPSARSEIKMSLGASMELKAMELDLLNELDDRVKALLKRLQHLQREREQLTKRLAQCELGFGEASARLREYEELRSRVRMVIQNILIRFDSLNLE